MSSVIPKIRFITTRAFSTVRDVELCSKGFDEIIRTRTSCRKYKSQDVEEKTAPTARNWQPYKIVIMKDKDNLDKLSKIMPEKNGKVIRQVPGVAVFLADTEPIAMAEDFKGLWKRQKQDMSKIPHILSGFSKSIGPEGLVRSLAKCQLKQASNASFSQEYYTNREWSIKQSMLPLEIFVMSCQAQGLSTIILEGFDGRHVRELIGCSKRYFVSGIVPFGYSDEEGVQPTMRYDADKMVFNERFGNSRFGIPEVNRS